MLELPCLPDANGLIFHADVAAIKLKRVCIRNPQNKLTRSARNPRGSSHLNRNAVSKSCQQFRHRQLQFV